MIELASDFGKELTTYDYAHPDVQANRLAPLTTRQVQDKVRRAFPDLALYQAVSVGDRPDAIHVLYGFALVVAMPLAASLVRERAPRGQAVALGFAALFAAGLAIRGITTAR